MNAENHEYSIDLSWKKERTGTLSSSELNDQLDVATPPPFEGGIEGVWSPEHLFISSVSSCFMTTFVAIAKYSKLSFEDINVKAVGKLGKENGKLVVSEITLRPKLVISDEKLSAKALRIMEKAEKACLITRSIKTDIIFEPNVVVGAMN